MLPLRRTCLVGSVAVLAVLGSVPVSALAKSSAPTKTTTLANAHALLKSRELWATIDVCSPIDQPDTVGIRGSMPGDGHAGDRVYMSFRLQYMNPSQQWVDVAGALSPVRPRRRRRGGARGRLELPARARGRQARLPASWGGGLPVEARQEGAAVGHEAHHGRPQERRGVRPGGLQRRYVLDRMNSRGSLVMMPSTPMALSLAIIRASSTVHT